MGFRPKSRVYKITWPYGHDLHGFEVQCRALRLGELLDMAAKASTAKETPEEMGTLVDDFAALITDWNREDDDGNPVPVSADGLRTLEASDFFDLLEAYLNAGGMSVPDPLPGSSPTGDRSPVQLPPMDEL